MNRPSTALVMAMSLVSFAMPRTIDSAPIFIPRKHNPFARRGSRSRGRSGGGGRGVVIERPKFEQEARFEQQSRAEWNVGRPRHDKLPVNIKKIRRELRQRDKELSQHMRERHYVP